MNIHFSREKYPHFSADCTGHVVGNDYAFLAYGKLKLKLKCKAIYVFLIFKDPKLNFKLERMWTVDISDTKSSYIMWNLTRLLLELIVKMY